MSLYEKQCHFDRDYEKYICEMKLQRVGDYLLGEKLGEGSFAKVRVGLHVMSREKVILAFFQNSELAR